MNDIRQLEADLCEALEIKPVLAITEQFPAVGLMPPRVTDPGSFGLIVEALGKRALGFEIEPVPMLSQDPVEVHYAARIFRVTTGLVPPYDARDTRYLLQSAEAFPDWREAICRAALAYLKAGVCEEIDVGTDEDLDAGMPGISPVSVGVDRAAAGGDKAVSWCPECQMNLMLHSHKMDCSRSGRIGALPATEIRLRVRPGEPDFSKRHVLMGLDGRPFGETGKPAVESILVEGEAVQLVVGAEVPYCAEAGKIVLKTIIDIARGQGEPSIYRCGGPSKWSMIRWVHASSFYSEWPEIETPDSETPLSGRDVPRGT